MAFDIGLPHVDAARQSKAGTDGGGGDSVLSGARLGDDAFFAHALCQQNLPQAIIDFMRPRMIEILPLEDNGQINARLFLDISRQTSGFIEGRGASDKGGGMMVELLSKVIIATGFVPLSFQLQQQRHEGLGDIASAIDAKMTALIGTDIIFFQWVRCGGAMQHGVHHDIDMGFSQAMGNVQQ